MSDTHSQNRVAATQTSNNTSGTSRELVVSFLGLRVRAEKEEHKEHTCLIFTTHAAKKLHAL